MKAYRQPVLLLLAALACVITLARGWPVQAQTLQFPNYTGHVNDFANVLDAGSKQQLETILLNFEQRSGAQIAVVTVPTLQDRPIEEYANGLYRAWGIGAKSGEHKDKGALLLVAPNDRKSRLEVGYGLEGDLPDGLAGEMLRRMRPYFQQQQWSQGLTVGTRTLVDTLAQKWNISVEGIDQQYAYTPLPAAQPSDGQSAGSGVCLMLGILLFILFIMALARRGRRGGRSSWFTAPMIFNSSGGDFGGGSWGSSSSDSSSSGGSDWGGFSGGDSGGGGASDSW